jgi:hypothetical protein
MSQLPPTPLMKRLTRFRNAILVVIAFRLCALFLSNDKRQRIGDSIPPNRSFRRTYSAKQQLPQGVHSDKNRSAYPPIALLIAGQCHRFIYREQSGPLFHPINNETKLPAYEIDVFIALQCGTPARAYVGRVDTPPYMKKVNLSDIVQWYTARGARTVTIQIVDTQTMDTAFREISRQAIASVKRLNAAFNLSDVPAWNAEVRKFYMRHLIFSISQVNGRQYDAYIFHREDNFFFAPLELDEVFFRKNNSATEPFVIVNAHCEFGGSYSDKMYVSNYLGAALLFSSTKAEFLSWMKRFLLVGLYRIHHSKTMAYQAEALVRDTLNNAEVERVDMGRVDVRYNFGIKCVPSLYFNCMAEEAKVVALSIHNLVVCDSLRKRKRRFRFGS